MSSESYAFGDTDVAADRLRLLARLFEPEMTRIIREWGPQRPKVAVDLGCGPGYTTLLLGETLSPGTLVGIDASERFVSIAQGLGGLGVRFVEHDLAGGVVPVGRVDVMFAHLLLAHLRSPREAVAGWTRALAPGGVMLIDEVESIETDNELLRDYLGLADHVVAARGATINVGPLVADLGSLPEVSILSSEVVAHSVAVSEAVEMFIMNFRTIRGDPSLREDLGALDAIAQGLRRLRGAAPAQRVVWRMRQVALRAA